MSTPRDRVMGAIRLLQRAAWNAAISESEYHSMVLETLGELSLLQRTATAMGWLREAQQYRVKYVRDILLPKRNLVVPQIVKARPQFKKGK